MIALLAPRPRVEERQLIAAFAERGHEARLLAPDSLALPLNGPQPELPALAVERRGATGEGATLAALLAAGGGVVVNRAATVRLLADRLALLRHLILAGIPVPETVVSFGAGATLAAFEQLGYPALLLSPTVDPHLPDAVVEDRDAAEALIEQRGTLADERAVLVQHYLPLPGYRTRIVVVGAHVAGIEKVCGVHGEHQPYPAAPGELVNLGEQLIGRLGSGTYAIDVVETGDGPVVTGVQNLVDFRTLAEQQQLDIAGRIADFALAELAVAEARRG